MKLVPVDYDPFQNDTSSLEPVEAPPEFDSANINLTPVDYDPFDESRAVEAATWGETVEAIPAQIKGGAEQALGGGMQAVSAPPTISPDKITTAGKTGLPGISQIPSLMGAVIDYYIKGTPIGKAKEKAKEKITEFGEYLHERGSERIEGATPENQTFWQQAVSTAGVSAGTMVPAGAAAFVTKNPHLVAGSFGAQEFGRAFGDAKAEGKDDTTAFRHATASGVLEAGTEYLPAKSLFKAGSKPFERLVNFMAKEIPGENIAELGQMVSERINGLRDEITGKDVIDTIKLTTAATLITGTGQTAAAQALDKVNKTTANVITEENKVVAEDITAAATVEDAIQMANDTLMETEVEQELQAQVESLQDTIELPPQDTKADVTSVPDTFIDESGQVTSEAVSAPVSDDLITLPDTQTLNVEKPPVAERRADTQREDRGTRRRFQKPDEFLAQRHREKVAAHGLSEAQAEAFEPKLNMDKTTGYYGKRELEPSIERAQQHSAETGEPSFYVEVDLGNMGGGNKAKGSNAKFDKEFFTPEAKMLQGELEATGGDIVPILVGGDELGFIAVNTTEELLNKALKSADAKTIQMAKDQGMGDIKNPKYPDSKERGINLYFGVTPILEGKTAEEIRTDADTQVGRNKIERNENVNRSETEKIGTATPEGQTGGTEKSSGRKVKSVSAETGRTQGQVDEQQPTKTEKRKSSDSAGSDKDSGKSTKPVEAKPDKQRATGKQTEPAAEAKKSVSNRAADTETSVRDKKPVTPAAVKDLLADLDEGSKVTPAEKSVDKKPVKQKAKKPPESKVDRAKEDQASSKEQKTDYKQGRDYSDKALKTSLSIGVPEKTIKQAIEPLNKKFKDQGIKIDFVNEQSELMGLDKPGIYIQAVINKNTGDLILVRKNFSNEAEIKKVLRHELLWHHGFSLFDEQTRNEIYDKINATREDKTHKETWNQIEKDYAEEDANTQAEEFLALLQESKQGRLSKAYSEVVALIQKALRALGIIDGPISTTEIKALLSRVERKAVKGGKQKRKTSDPNILYSKKASPPVIKEGFQDWKIPDAMAGHYSDMMTKGEKLRTALRSSRRKLQDKFIVWDTVQKEIKKRDGKMSDFSDAYNKFTLIEGKIGDKFRKLFDDHIKPLIDDIATSLVTVDQLDKYLYAKFAPQRNARIAEINKDLPDGGSGMTNKEADEILNSFTPEETKRLEKMAKKVYAMQRYKLDVLVESGRITEALRDDLLKDDRYVPLKGFADTGDLVTNTEATGRGFDQAKDAFKRAKGRKTFAAEIFTTAVRDVENAIISAEKNRVGQSVLKLVMDNPNKNLWKPNPIKVQKAFNKASGQVEQRVITSHKQLAMDPNVFVTWVNGKPYAIEFRDKPSGESSLARAVKNMGVDSVPWYVSYLASYNRWLSYANTALSPEFLLTNPIRDIQTALVKSYGDFDSKIARNVIKNLPKAIRGAVGGIGIGVFDGKFSGKIADWSPEWTNYYKEYQAEGGKTDYFRTKSVNQMKKELDAELKSTAKGVYGSGRRALRKAYHAIENGNAILENMTRVSMYITLREAGYSEHKAAVAAKNLTVNFNRKGEAGALINSLYLFYNASFQGAHLTIKLMRNPKVQKLMVAAGAAVAALTQYNILAGGDDDDGEANYFKIPEYEKERNLIIMWPDGSGKYSKIPLPYGLNVPLNAAAALTHIANGRDPMREAARLGGSAWNSFSPVGENGWNIIAPTVLDPFVDIRLNRNYADRKIMPSNNPFEKTPTPNSQKAFPSTGPVYKRIAETLNEVSGGDYHRPGKVDISPEWIQHLAETVAGAAGGFANRVAAWATDPDFPTTRTPFLRKFYGEKSPYTVNQQYRANKEHIYYLEKRYKYLIERKSTLEGGKEYRDFKKNNKEGIGLIGPLKMYERQLKKLYEARSEYKIKGNDVKAKEADDRIREAQSRYNAKYNDVFLDHGIAKEFDFL